MCRPLAAPSLNSAPITADRPRIFSPGPGFSPAFSTSAAALPSGYGRGSSTIIARRSGTEKGAEACDRKPQEVMEVVQEAEDQRGGDDEVHAGRKGAADQGPGLEDVFLEDGAAAEQPQHANHHHRRWNRGRNGQARDQA